MFIELCWAMGSRQQLASEQGWQPAHECKGNKKKNMFKENEFSSRPDSLFSTVQEKSEPICKKRFCLEFSVSHTLVLMGQIINWFYYFYLFIVNGLRK